MERTPISISIDSFTDQLSNGKLKTFYTISIRSEGLSWDINRRYKEFEFLHKKLKQVCGKLPILPKKTLFKIKSEADKEKRKLKLNEYLQVLAERNDTSTNQYFLEFTEVHSLFYVR